MPREDTAEQRTPARLARAGNQWRGLQIPVRSDVAVRGIRKAPAKPAAMVLAAKPAAPVTHPNLFLNRAEIEQVKAKIAKYPWAAAALAKTKKDALTDNALQQALYYTFTGDTSFADRARGSLLGTAQSDLQEIAKLDIDKDNHWGPWGASWGGAPGLMT